MIFNKIVDIWRAPLVDNAYGHKRDWTQAVRVASLPASVQGLVSNSPSRPAASEEKLVDRETTITRQRVYLRWHGVLSTDRILIDGAWWEVFGDPEEWGGPISFVNTSHVRIIVRKVTH